MFLLKFPLVFITEQLNAFDLTLRTFYTDYLVTHLLYYYY